MLLPSNDALRRLRRLLRDMTESRAPASEHRAMLARIASETPHTIQPIESGRDVAQFTCGMHAFGFEASLAYVAIASHGRGQVFAGPEFFRWLVESGRLVEITGSALPPDAVVMYFADRSPVHVGRLRTATRVVSKWGVGLLCEHEAPEVPEQYGSEVRFFANVDYAAAFAHFVAFAEQQGLHF